MPCMESCGDVTNLGGVHCLEPEYEKVDSMWPFTSRTLKPTLDQSMVLTGGGGKAAIVGEVDVVEWGARREAGF